MNTPNRLRGIFTPNIVPLDDRGEINEAELRRYVDWLIDHGVHGLYPNVYAFFKEIGRNTPVDVTLYNIPMFASPIDAPTVQRLSEECPRIVAIKDSSGDISHMQRMIAAVRPNRPDFSFLTGWDAALMPMLLIGCDGGTHAVSGVAPELLRRSVRTHARWSLRRSSREAISTDQAIRRDAAGRGLSRGRSCGGKTAGHQTGRWPTAPIERSGSANRESEPTTCSLAG